MNDRKPKTDKRLRVLCAPALLAVTIACSGASTSNTLCVPTGGATVASNLALSLSPAALQVTANGTGFIDIDSKDANENPVQRRCTMSLRPIDASYTHARVWTAGHCPFDPQTVEFKNSKATLQIFYKNGYFSVPIELDGVKSLANFAEFVNSPLVGNAVPDLDRHLGGALPSSQHDVCVDQYKIFKDQLGTNAKNIACFSQREMRGLKVQLLPSEKTKAVLRSVLDELRQRENAVMSALDDTTKKQLNAYLLSHMTEQRRVSDMRSLAYFLNKQFCDATEKARPIGEDKTKVDMDTGCDPVVRSFALQQLEAKLDAQDFAVIKAVAEDETTPLQALRNKSLGCNNVNVDTITTVTDLSTLTPCDMANYSRSFWRKYVDQGPTFAGAQENSSTFGLSGTNYFGFFTNSIKGNGSASARLFSLNSSVVSEFEYAARLDSSTRLNHNVFLINYDKSRQGINPVKGASGSILSIFGSIPAALLSTVDGEPTSGGAGVTPLPEIDDDDTLPASNAGC